jgi:two-component system OmpR family sensor kinase
VRRLRTALGSLRWRLTLVYVALIAVLLAGLGAFQYLELQRNLVNVRAASLDGDIAEASRLSGRVTIPAIAGQPSRSVNIDYATLRDALCGNRTGLAASLTTTFAASTLAERVHTVSGRTVSVIVYDHNLNAVGHNPEAQLSDIPRVDSSALHEAIAGRRSSAQFVDGPGGTELAIAYPVQGADRACGAVQLSTSTSPIDDTLSRERFVLGLGGGAVLLLALVLGLLLTGRALTPLRRLTETSRQLAGGDLRARSRLGPRSDEIGALAHSFDDMAERLEALFVAQGESETRMRRFIADASHELRTPVTALKGYIDVLRRGASREPEALEAALATMAREAERMRLLILDLLTLARIDAQRQLAPSTVDLNAVLAAVLDDGVPGMPPQLERQFAGGQLLVTADQDALATMARNLLVNACKYAPGAVQQWSTARDDGRARFSVNDQGPGISAADLPHIFERFYRGEKTRAREEGGSGLGLSIVQGLARAQGGDVAIDSREGGGTTVVVWLPLAGTAGGGADDGASTQDAAPAS